MKTHLERCIEIIQAEIKRLSGRPMSKDTVNELKDFLEWTYQFAATERGEEFNQRAFSTKAVSNFYILGSLIEQAKQDGLTIGVINVA